MGALHDIPIKRKLTAIIMIASTVALLLVSAGFIAFEIFTFRQTMKNDLSTLAQLIGDRSTAALAFKNVDDAGEELHALVYKKHITAAVLYDDNGDILASWRSPEAAKEPLPKHPQSDGPPKFKPNRLVLFHDVHKDGDLVGTLFLESDQGPKNPWNATAGASVTLHRNFDAFFEYGFNFDDVKIVATGLTFRF